MDVRYVVKIVATFTADIPIVAGIVKYKAAGKYFRVFLFFLIYGFLTDLFVWLLIPVAKPVSFALFVFYPLVESVFFSLFIYGSGNSKLTRKTSLILIAFLIPFWITCYFIYGDVQKHGAAFNTIYEILISFIAGFALLKLVEETTSLTREPLFWFLFGIFISCFCTFFVSSLMETGLLQKIWFIYNIVNISVYFIFTKAFLTIPSKSMNTNSLLTS